MIMTIGIQLTPVRIVRIKLSDWNYYKKFPGYTKEENNRKYLLFANGSGENTPCFVEVDIQKSKWFFY